ncbi:hypothetical protein BZA77DRAFT_367752 [Pyronema omphalodes]|nr:hypothetical protein BZA77DRAFT_367752 [Pyronema omphalodes]
MPSLKSLLRFSSVKSKPSETSSTPSSTTSSTPTPTSAAPIPVPARSTIGTISGRRRVTSTPTQPEPGLFSPPTSTSTPRDRNYNSSNNIPQRAVSVSVAQSMHSHSQSQSLYPPSPHSPRSQRTQGAWEKTTETMETMEERVLRKSHDTAPLWRSPGGNFSSMGQGSTGKGTDTGRTGGGGGGGGMVDTGAGLQNSQGAALAAAGAVMIAGSYS